MARTGPRRAPAFTLVELLVVLVIVLLVSAVTLPAILPALSHRQVSEAARILQAALVQARDTAIRFNAPRGVRFLPDPTYFDKPGTTILAYNRMVPIEPGPDYSNGLVTVWPDPAVFDKVSGSWVQQLWQYTPPPYPTSTSGTLGGPSGSVYPTYPAGHPLNPFINNYAGRVLMIEQAPFQANNASPPPTSFVNAPTSWYWNVRVGDKLTLGASGGTYTIVGPCTVNPFSGGGNPELFVNVGQPGDLTNYLSRTYTGPGGTATGVTQTVPVEYLLLVNGVDDDGDGYTDEGWDGVDNNDQMLVNGNWQKFGYNAIIDDLGDPSGQTITTEWEPEKWLGIVGSQLASPSALAAYDTTVSTPSSGTFSLPTPMSYTIQRRPVPTQSARETMLPNNVVVDATTWNSTHERSRLPVDPFSGYCDIMLLPSGQVVPTTLYSNPASFNLSASFYQFWLSERQDVHEVTDLWGAATNPNSKLSFLLPMPQDAYNNYIAAGNSFSNQQPNMALAGERMLITLFSRTGQITNNPIESFDVTDVNAPYYETQLGTRDAK